MSSRLKPIREADLCVAVNLSPRQFADPRLVDHVSRTLHETGLPPTPLEIEITEGVMLHDSDTALATMSALRDLGVRLAIDRRLPTRS
jgi:EAL domain-containing protein (putative c-di-GMP-specific phosphodiesterase class I)